MSALDDLEKSVEKEIHDFFDEANAFFTAAENYFVAHLKADGWQAVKDGVDAADVAFAGMVGAGQQKKIFSFGNIFSAFVQKFGEDVAKSLTGMINCATEAFVQEKRHNEAAAAPAPETPAVPSTPENAG